MATYLRFMEETLVRLKDQLTGITQAVAEGNNPTQIRQWTLALRDYTWDLQAYEETMGLPVTEPPYRLED